MVWLYISLRTHKHETESNPIYMVSACFAKKEGLISLDPGLPGAEVPGGNIA